MLFWHILHAIMVFAVVLTAGLYVEYIVTAANLKLKNAGTIVAVALAAAIIIFTVIR